jgi:hypothetical protein
MDTEYLTPQEIAKILRCSAETIIRRFENRKGVVDLGTTETRFKRRYRVLRIPRHCFEQYLIEIGVEVTPQYSARSRSKSK